MIFPWLAAQAGVAALVVGGAAGGFLSHTVRTRLAGMSKKGTPADKTLDKDAAVVPILVEPDQAMRRDPGGLRQSHDAWKADSADAVSAATPKTTASAPDPASTEAHDVSET